jgi:ribosome-binding factor A
MSKPTNSAPSQRMLRVGEQVRSAITIVLQRQEISDPILEATVVSISEVRMSTDLKVATAFVTPLGAANHDEIVTALNRHAKFIRGRIGGALRQLKNMPEVRFKDDTSFENFRKIDALLKSPEVQRDLAPKQEGEDQA